MKRTEFIKELKAAGGRLRRHGGNHDVYENPAANARAPVPRHREIADSLCELIRKQLKLK